MTESEAAIFSNLSINNGEVFVVESTGELFPAYEDYLDKIYLYRQPVWTCRLTGHTGLVYDEALRSEAEARRSLENLPDLFRPIILDQIQYSTESIEGLSTQIFNTLRNSFISDEPIRVLISGEWYDGRVIMMDPSPTVAEDGPLIGRGCCRVVLLSGEDKIGEASISDFTHIQRRLSLPSKSLLKKYVRSVAMRFGQAGMPWLLQDEIAKKYSIQKDIKDVSLAEKLELSLVARKKETERKRAAKEAALNSTDIDHNETLNKRASKTDFAEATMPQDLDEFASDKLVQSHLNVIKYPILDEFLPLDKQTDPLLFPEPKCLNPMLSIASDRLFEKVLELWQFNHSFGQVLSISPMSLSDFIQSLEYDKLENPCIECILTRFVVLLKEAVGSAKSLAGHFQEYAKSIAENHYNPIPSFESLNIMSKSQDILWPGSPASEMESEDGTFAPKRSAPRRKPSTTYWYKIIRDFLEQEATSIPLVQKLLCFMEKNNLEIYSLPGSAKLMLLLLLKEVYLIAYDIDEFVEKEVEKSIDARLQVKEQGTRRRKLLKSEEDLETRIVEIDKHKNSLINASQASSSELKELSKEIKLTEGKLRSVRKEIAEADRIIARQKKEQRRHSAVRVRCLGEDRYLRRYWWFDASRIDEPNKAQIMAGILLLEDSTCSMSKCSWTFYDREEEIESLINCLNPLGSREVALLESLVDLKDIIVSSLREFPPNLVDQSLFQPNQRILAEDEAGENNNPAESSSGSESAVIVSRERSKRRGRARLGQPVSSQSTPSFLRYKNQFV